MAIYENISSFCNRPVFEYKGTGSLPDDPSTHAIRIGVDWDEYEEDSDAFANKLKDLFAESALDKVEALVVGCWSPEDPDGIGEHLQTIIAAAPRLPQLKGIFFGDIVMEEQEISWIEQSDVGPLIQAFPNLEEFVVRGGSGLGFTSVNHSRLKKLIVQTGGLSKGVIASIFAAQLPDLEHLELWLGDNNYGWDGDATLFATLFSGELFPALNYLGLRNSVIADDLAVALNDAVLLDRLSVLDLSMGTLGDIGAAALVKNQAIAKLDALNLNHHYIGEQLMADLLKIGCSVDLGNRETEGEYGRYCEVSE